MNTTKKKATCDSKIIAPREHIEHIEHTYDFMGDTEEVGWYSFPATEDGRPDLTKMGEGAIESLKRCMAQPEVYTKQGVRTMRTTTTVPAVMRCCCGEEFYLEGSYMGADGCPECGRWYNMNGTPLTNPNTWRRNEDW